MTSNMILLSLLNCQAKLTFGLHNLTLRQSGKEKVKIKAKIIIAVPIK
jgi:hypothetical protein